MEHKFSEEEIRELIGFIYLSSEGLEGEVSEKSLGLINLAIKSQISRFLSNLAFETRGLALMCQSEIILHKEGIVSELNIDKIIDSLNQIISVGFNHSKKYNDIDLRKKNIETNNIIEKRKEFVENIFTEFEKK